MFLRLQQQSIMWGLTHRIGRNVKYLSLRQDNDDFADKTFDLFVGQCNHYGSPDNHSFLKHIVV